MLRKYLLGLICLFVLSSPARAIEGVMVGGEVGHVSLSGATGSLHSNALGFGAFVGLRPNPLYDVTARVGYSSHDGGGGLTLLYPTLSADFHLLYHSEFDLTVGGGPGFYSVDGGGTKETYFGLNGGINGDVILSDTLRLGLGWRYHAPLGANADDFFTILMRVAVLFEMGG